jgi:hypothetical protein
MNPAGTFQWVKEIPHSQTITGDATLGRITNLAVDNQNSLYVTGFQRGFINWGPFITTSIGSNDALILKCSSSGDFLWGKTAGGGGNERVDAISLDNSGNIFISGNFGPTAMFDTISVTGSGQLNSFSAKLSNPPLGIQPVGNNIPSSYSLSNYPNPFNPVTKIQFSIPDAGAQYIAPVRIVVYDIIGKEVASPVNQKLNPGSYEITFDGSNLNSGIYFYSLFVNGSLIDSRKMVLVK